MSGRAGVVAAIARRTRRALVDAPGAAASLVGFYALTGLLFALPLFLSGQATLRGLLDVSPFLMSLLAPALTMGLIAEELRSGTFETLATSAVEDSDIVLGKYLGYAAVLAGVAAGLGYYPLVLAPLTGPPGLDWPAALGTLTAILFMGLLFGAIGLFASSLARGQAGAFLLGFACCFAVAIGGRLAQALPGPLAALAEYAGLEAHLQALARGVLDTRDLVYFVSGTTAFLLLAVQRMESRRRLRQAAGTAAVLAALAGLNVLSIFAHTRADFSPGKSQSLSPAAGAALEKLKDPLVVEAFVSGDLPPPFSTQARFARDLLGDLKAAGRGRVRVVWSDPDRDAAAAARARQAGIPVLRLSTAGRGRFEAREAMMGLTLLSGGRSEIVPALGAPSDLEYELTRRVRKLSGAPLKRVGFVTGHGERSPDDPSLAEFFARLSETVEPRAVKLDKLPEDLDALWLAGPAAALKPAEVERLARFAAAGKTLAVFAGTRLADFTAFQASPLDAGLSPLLARWGVSLEQGLVADAQAQRVQVDRRAGAAQTSEVVDYVFVPVATRLAEKSAATATLRAVPFPFVSPVDFEGAKAAPTRFTPLAWSSHGSWLYAGGDLSPRAPETLSGGKPGPFVLAATAEGSAGRLLVVGTAYQLDPRVSVSREAAAFIQNLVEWSAEDESLLALRGRAQVYHPLKPLPPAALSTARWLLALGLPLAAAALFAGLALENKRRREAAVLVYADV